MPPSDTRSSSTVNSNVWPAAINKICIIGTGLIGASLALALKRSGYIGEISGCARTRQTADRAIELGVVDSATTDCVAAVQGADMVVLAVPMKGMLPVLEQIAPHIDPGTIITDGGSVKSSFVEDARSTLGSLTRVVPGHPIAGKEFSGVDAGDASLYNGQLVILTPLPETEQSATAIVSAMWQQCGARVEELDCTHHDRVLAATSHVPHVMAFALVDLLSSHQSREEVFRYSAGGFRDFTRIASGDPVMWKDICLTNREPINEILLSVISQLEIAREHISEGNGEVLESMFRNAKTTRDALIQKYDRDLAMQRTPLPDAAAKQARSDAQAVNTENGKKDSSV